MSRYRPDHKTAIIITFAYFDSNRWIPGSLFDLMFVINHCVESRYDDIRILTDFTSQMINEDATGVRKRVYDKIKQDVHTNIQYENIDSIREIFKGGDRTGPRFVYYSGHCSNGRLQLPSYGSLLTRKFKSIAIRSSNNIFFLIDCCQCEGVNLLYKIDTDRMWRDMRLDPVAPRDAHLNKIVLPAKEGDYTKCNILCISSSGSDENTYTTENGSVFTKMVLGILSRYRTESNTDKVDRITLKRFIGDVFQQTNTYDHQFKPSPTVQISRRTIYHLFSWIYSNRRDMQVTISPASLSVSIKR